MMYSCINTILQFLAAIYVTIVFDNILFRRFWAPNYYSIIQKQIKSYNLPITGDIKVWMTSQIEGKNLVFQENSRKRGTIFLYTTFVILVCIGVLDTHSEILTFPVAILLLASYIVALIMPYILHRWIWLIMALIIESIIFVISFYCPLSSSINKEHIVLFRSVFISLLILPIAYQIVRSWSYSTAMHCFVIEKLNIINREYTKAKDAILRKDKDLIPDSYRDIFSKMAFDIPNEDLQLTQINDTLLTELKKIFDNLSFRQLCQAYWKNPNIEELNIVPVLIDENESISRFNDDVQTINKTDKILRLINVYENMKEKPKIEDFCMSHEVEACAFRLQRNQYLKSLVLKR